MVARGGKPVTSEASCLFHRAQSSDLPFQPYQVPSSAHLSGRGETLWSNCKGLKHIIILLDRYAAKKNMKRTFLILSLPPLAPLFQPLPMESRGRSHQKNKLSI